MDENAVGAISEATAAATRVCAACGMCCNGVLFSHVVLQPTDVARTLRVRGLKLKSRGDGLHLYQPCPAHVGSCCTVYEQRPERCRVFNCRQIEELMTGKSSEVVALERIAHARKLADRVRELLRLAGDRREHKALATRFEMVLLPPLDPAPEAAAAREALVPAMQELEAVLLRDFRVALAGGQAEETAARGA
ncbi:MAG: YkgJ family cysteine cluster protein [Blastochloris sp.]|nr:YkgJ family cysteine cluster protein [Blastochloris sp.]